MDEINAADGWCSLLGHAWADMLQRHCLDPTGTVVEIGPGFTDKIARGLAALDFRGLVVLVEPNAAAAAWASGRYRYLLPRAEVLVVRRPVPYGTLPRARPVDALLSNHIFDDLILNAALTPETSAKIFAGMQPGVTCSHTFVRRWHELLAPSGRIEQLTLQVAADFTAYVAELRPRLVLLNEYPSWRHDLHGLGAIHRQALRLMCILETNLGAECVESNVLAGPGHESLVRWLIKRPERDAAAWSHATSRGRLAGA